MQAIIRVLTLALSIPMMLSLSSGIVGGIWLIVLGMWAPIGMRIITSIVGCIALKYLIGFCLLVVSTVFNMSPKGNMGIVIFTFIFTKLGASVFRVAWAYMILKVFAGMGPDEAQWPLMLISVGVATLPMEYITTKMKDIFLQEEHTTYVFFFSAGYLVVIGARLFGSTDFVTCLWILIATELISMTFQGVNTTQLRRARKTYEL